MPNWKSTLNLPKTAFSMKASLQTAEPAAIARWDSMKLYEQIRARRAGAPRFVRRIHRRATHDDPHRHARTIRHLVASAAVIPILLRLEIVE